MIVENAIYVDGRRAAEPGSLKETYEACREQKGVAWIGLYKPSEGELESVSEEFELHPLAVEDALEAHQRPKLERYGGTLFVVLRPARYLDEEERIEFGETYVFVGEDFVITARHGEAPDIGGVRRRLEGDPDHLKRGPVAILHAIMDQVVDDYGPVVAGLENDVEEIEAQVFDGSPYVSRRIYELSREVIQFQRAADPLRDVLGALIRGEAVEVDDEVRRYFRDVSDHAEQVSERLSGYRDLLQNILGVNLTMVSLSQNEQVKKISAWAAILFAPTLVGTVYGMNFDHMPELHWLLGYPFALALMVAISVGLYLTFKRRGWM